jgi:hypothetical protein
VTPSADDPARQLVARAERLDELAETAELMGDTVTAARFHADATRCREQALAHLDARTPPEP